MAPNISSCHTDVPQIPTKVQLTNCTNSWISTSFLAFQTSSLLFPLSPVAMMRISKPPSQKSQIQCVRPMQLGATRGLLSKNRLGEVLAETEIQRSAKSRGTLSREFYFREIGNFCPPPPPLSGKF